MSEDTHPGKTAGTLDTYDGTPSTSTQHLEICRVSFNIMGEKTLACGRK